MWIFPPQLIQSRKSFTDVSWCVPWLTLDPVKVTINTDPHRLDVSSPGWTGFPGPSLPDAWGYMCTTAPGSATSRRHSSSHPLSPQVRGKQNCLNGNLRHQKLRWPHPTYWLFPSLPLNLRRAHRYCRKSNKCLVQTQWWLHFFLMPLGNAVLWTNTEANKITRMLNKVEFG